LCAFCGEGWVERCCVDLGIAPCFAILRGLLQAVSTTVMIEANPTRNQIADLRQRIDLLRGFL